MKLHTIEVTNLNSLYGDQKIDLENGLRGAPLFLIEGPTGAGKSTLMDAVSLALFGTTPRLAGHSSEKAVAEQVMSRGTGECRAAIEFSKLDPTGARSRFRAVFAAHRAHKKPHGAMQDTRRSLERLLPDGTWELLVSDHRAKVIQPVFDEVLEKFEPKDFQRSMLLAQGRFDAMLHALPEERAAILERLTNTESYQVIGERAARVRGAWEGRLAELRARRDAILPLTPEQVAQARERAETARAAIAENDAQRKVLEASAAWLTRGVEIEEQAARARAAVAQVEQDRASIAEDLDALAEHERCAGALAALDRKDQADASVASLDESIRGEERELPELRERAGRTTQASDRLRVHHATAQAALETLDGPAARARAALDAVEVAERERERAEIDVRAAQEKVAQAAQSVEEKRAAAKAADEEAEVAKESLEPLDAVRPLAQALPALAERCARLSAAHESVGAERTAARDDANRIEGQRTALGAARDAAEATRVAAVGPLKDRAQSAIARARDALGRAEAALEEGRPGRETEVGGAQGERQAAVAGGAIDGPAASNDGVTPHEEDPGVVQRTPHPAARIDTQTARAGATRADGTELPANDATVANDAVVGQRTPHHADSPTSDDGPDRDLDDARIDLAIDQLEALEARHAEASRALRRTVEQLQAREQAARQAIAQAEQAAHAIAQTQAAQRASSQAAKSVAAARDAVATARAVAAPLDRIAALAEERQQLVDGEPCPLCGSEAHPFVADSAHGARLRGLDAEIAAARDALERAQRAEHEAVEASTAARGTADRTRGVAESAAVDAAERIAALLAELQQVDDRAQPPAAPPSDRPHRAQPSTTVAGGTAPSNDAATSPDPADAALRKLARALQPVADALGAMRSAPATIEAQPALFAKPTESWRDPLADPDRTRALQGALTVARPAADLSAARRATADAATRAEVATTGARELRVTLSTAARAAREALAALAQAEREQVQAARALDERQARLAQATEAHTARVAALVDRTRGVRDQAAELLRAFAEHGIDAGQTGESAPTDPAFHGGADAPGEGHLAPTQGLGSLTSSTPHTPHVGQRGQTEGSAPRAREPNDAVRVDDLDAAATREVHRVDRALQIALGRAQVLAEATRAVERAQAKTTVAAADLAAEERARTQAEQHRDHAQSSVQARRDACREARLVAHRACAATRDAWGQAQQVIALPAALMTVLAASISTSGAAHAGDPSVDPGTPSTGAHDSAHGSAHGSASHGSASPGATASAGRPVATLRTAHGPAGATLGAVASAPSYAPASLGDALVRATHDALARHPHHAPALTPLPDDGAQGLTDPTDRTADVDLSLPASPEGLRAAQQASVRALGRALDDLSAAAREAGRQHHGAETRLATFKEQRASAQKQANEAQESLDEAIATLDPRVDVDGLRGLRLPEARLAAIRSGREALERARTQAQTRLHDATAAAGRHATQRPASLAEDATADAVQAMLAQLSDDRAPHEAALADATATLQQARQQAQAVRDAQRALDEAERSARVWLTLHELIGVGDGKRFKLFAQALNLDQLLTRANGHLSRFADRYRLRVVVDPENGLPTLDFEVEDRWRPGTFRSLKTLSGGESFLVSLALALGLSDLKTSSMPVETLLLDEGFGTLDPQTLEVALGALNQLQASGRQVGLISHVQGLRERIQARIVVEPLGEGRSQARIAD